MWLCQTAPDELLSIEVMIYSKPQKKSEKLKVNEG